nr:hypothetical protein GCM10020093_021310 [Planobispora longispora]
MRGTFIVSPQAQGRFYFSATETIAVTTDRQTLSLLAYVTNLVGFGDEKLLAAAAEDSADDVEVVEFDAGGLARLGPGHLPDGEEDTRSDHAERDGHDRRGVWALIAGPGPSALERKTLKSIKVRVERVGMTARQPC